MNALINVKRRFTKHIDYKIERFDKSEAYSLHLKRFAKSKDLWKPMEYEIEC